VKKFGLGMIAAALVAAAPAAHAATVTWNAWDPNTVIQNPTAGSVTGAMGAVTVTYNGEVGTFQSNYPSWTPSSSYVGGTIGNAPSPADGIFHIVGGGTNTDTITFSTAVLNPVIAIWSLGQGGGQAAFAFTSPFTIEAGGPSAEYGGTTITSSGNTVYGFEGNGVIQFNGSFTSLSFTTPLAEDWYGFAVGTAGVPEPATWAMMMGGLFGVGAALRRRKQMVPTAA
jgi:hypothetical protein